MKYQGAGEVSIARLDPSTKRPVGAFKFLGCVDTFEPKFAVQLSSEHFERCTGLGLLDDQRVKSVSGSLDLSLTQWDLATLAWMTSGTGVAEGSPGTASIYTLPMTDIINGDYWHLGSQTGNGHQNVTGVVLTDSASPPNTLVLDTDYSLDAVYGTVKFLDVSGLTQPFKTNAYGYTMPATVAMLNNAGRQYAVRFNSKNVFNELAKGVENIYVWQPSPIASLPGVSDDFVTFQIGGPVFADLTRASDATYGQFGSIAPEALVS